MTAERYFGLFEELRRLALPGLSSSDLYQGFNAALYDQAVGQDLSDLETIISFVREKGGPVLELCCGSGRLAIPIAEAGFEVHGVDASIDMLKLLEQKLRMISPAVRARVSWEAGDVRDLELERAFPCVVLGATTMCLFPTREDRIRLMRTVRRQLAEGGEFWFDWIETDDGILSRQERDLLVIPLGGRNVAGGFTLTGRRHDKEAGTQILNLYSELIERSGRTVRYLGSSTKTILAWPHLEEELEEAGLKVAARKEMSRPTERGQETGEVQWAVRCRRAAR